MDIKPIKRFYFDFDFIFLSERPRDEDVNETFDISIFVPHRTSRIRNRIIRDSNLPINPLINYQQQLSSNYVTMK
jgi:hypothetical protein